MFGQTLEKIQESTRSLLKAKREQKLQEHQKHQRNVIFQQKRTLIMKQNMQALYQNTYTITQIIQDLYSNNFELITNNLNLLIEIFESSDKVETENLINDLYDFEIVDALLGLVTSNTKHIQKNSIYLLGIILSVQNNITNRSFVRKQGHCLLENLLIGCQDLDIILDVIKYNNSPQQILYCLGNNQSIDLSPNFFEQTLPQVFNLIIQNLQNIKLIECLSWFLGCLNNIDPESFYNYQLYLLSNFQNEQELFLSILDNILSYAQNNNQNFNIQHLMNKYNIIQLFINYTDKDYLLFNKILEFLSFVVQNNQQIYSQNKNDFTLIIKQALVQRRELIHHSVLQLMIDIMKYEKELILNNQKLEQVIKLFIYSPRQIKQKVLKLLKLALFLNKLRSNENYLEFLNELHSLNFSDILIQQIIEQQQQHLQKYLQIVLLIVQINHPLSEKLRNSKKLKNLILFSEENSQLIIQLKQILL